MYAIVIVLWKQTRTINQDFPVCWPICGLPGKTTGVLL